MARPPLAPRDRRHILVVGRRVAAALAERALDPAADLPRTVRLALAELVIEVDAEAHRRAGVEPPGPELRAALAAALPELAQPRPPPGG